MSVGTTRGEVSGSRVIGWFTGWTLWTYSRNVVVLVLVVDVLGGGAAAVTSSLVPVTKHDLLSFGLLGVCALVHLEATRGIERMRRTTGATGLVPSLDLNSVWNFSALLLLPPALATAMVLLTYSASTPLIANQIAIAVLSEAPDRFPGMSSSVAGVALIAAAAAVRWLINYSLVAAVIMLANPQNNAARALGPLGIQALEAGTTFVGVAAAIFVVYHPLLLGFLVIGLIVFHRCVLIDELEHAARTDEKTGLLTSVAWTQIAAKELARAERAGATVGILMIDLDNFKEINDIHGHPAGDEVLRAVARAIRAEVREYDHVGRFGGDEFVLAIPGVSGADLYILADRLRSRIAQLAVTMPRGPARTMATGLTASIGGALFPNTTLSLDELLLAADSAAYKAKDKGRNRVVLHPPTLQTHHPSIVDK
jgi:diguanylate cyclase (GGDEF)-like protein